MFALGLAVLLAGAELVVRAGTRLAQSLGIRPLIVGLTVVAVGTSMPELTVGIAASFEGNGGLAVGNIAGTNVVNILFILGLSAAVRPLPLHLQTIKLDLPVIIAASILLALLAMDGVLGKMDGAIMLAAAAAYTGLIILLSRYETDAAKSEFRDVYRPDASARRRLRNALILASGMALLVGGSELLVRGAVSIARSLDVSDAIIGLSIVAIGTSGPELATTVIATIRNERDVAVGNLLGSSIYNILVILGLTCLASPTLPVERQILQIDIPVAVAVALLCIPVFITGKRVSRIEGATFVALYVVYLTSLVLFRA